MYCEITIKHRSMITEAGLETALKGKLGPDLALDKAYSLSPIYRSAAPAKSLWAFESVNDCFVIVRKVTYRSSTFHIEGATVAVSVQRLLQAVQDFSGHLMAALAASEKNPELAVKSLAVQLFEDNGKETGLEGKLITMESIFRERFAWDALRANVIAFITGLFLIWLGLKQEPVRATLYSLAIVLILSLIESLISFFVGGGKIKWKFRQG